MKHFCETTINSFFSRFFCVRKYVFELRTVCRSDVYRATFMIEKSVAKRSGACTNNNNILMVMMATQCVWHVEDRFSNGTQFKIVQKPLSLSVFAYFDMQPLSVFKSKRIANQKRKSNRTNCETNKIFENGIKRTHTEKSLLFINFVRFCIALNHITFSTYTRARYLF